MRVLVSAVMIKGVSVRTSSFVDHVHLEREVLTVDGVFTWSVDVELLQFKSVLGLIEVFFNRYWWMRLHFSIDGSASILSFHNNFEGGTNVLKLSCCNSREVQLESSWSQDLSRCSGDIDRRLNCVG